MFQRRRNSVISALALTAQFAAKAVSWLPIPAQLLQDRLLAAARKAKLMQIPAFVRNLPLLLALASPAVLLAQFQPPNPDELKMTADPKAPGAAAVYLNYEETDNDAQHFQSYYARIKVLTEKGKEAATVEIPYWGGEFSISGITGRTIHADGTIVPLTGKPEDLLSFKTTTKEGDTVHTNRKVFTLPSVEVGSVLEYAYQLRFNAQFYWHLAPNWEVQKSYFIHKAHFLLMATSNLNLVYWPNLPQGASVKNGADDRYVLDITEVPPAPDEEWMPPIQSFLYRVRFYYGSIGASLNADNFWKAQTKDWSKDVDHFAEATKIVHAAVDSLVAPGDSDLDKAKKLYNAVQALDNTDYSRQKTDAERRELKLKEIKRAEDTWTQKSGTGNDIALLYLAMLRAAGLTAYGVKMVDREEGSFDPTYLSFSQFDAALVMLNIAGKEIILDPGEKMCPFQTVSWRHSNTAGVIQGSDGKNIKAFPGQAAVDNKLSRTGDVTLDAKGNASGSLRFSMTGQEALHWRQIALRNDENEAKKQFDHSLETIIPEGIEAHVDDFTGLDDPDASLVANITIRGALGTATSKRLLFPGFFLETHASHPFVDQEKRLEPVDMHYGEIVGDQITYHLPPGFTIEGAPQDATISWPDHAILITKSLASPDQIIIARKLARGFTFASQKEYQDLRGFYQKVAAADQGQLVLTTSATPKGN
jgi:hypothetical protein